MLEGIGMLMELRLTIPVGQLKKACGRDLEYYVGRYEVLKQSMEAMKEKHFKRFLQKDESCYERTPKKFSVL